MGKNECVKMIKLKLVFSKEWDSSCGGWKDSAIMNAFTNNNFIIEKVSYSYSNYKYILSYYGTKQEAIQQLTRVIEEDLQGMLKVRKLKQTIF